MKNTLKWGREQGGGGKHRKVQKENRNKAFVNGEETDRGGRIRLQHLQGDPYNACDHPYGSLKCTNKIIFFGKQKHHGGVRIYPVHQIRHHATSGSSPSSK